MNVIIIKTDKKTKEKLNSDVLIPNTLNIHLLKKLNLIKNETEFKKTVVLNNVGKIIII